MSAHKPHWESLPTEISLSILKQLPDPTSLHHCLEASPAAARVFDGYGAEIIEAIFVSGTIHKHTCAMIRMAACLRSSLPQAITNFGTFHEWYLYETTEYRDDIHEWTQAPLRLANQFSSGSDDAVVVPTSIIRGVLASHVRNENRMIGCLSTYLTRFRSLQPMHIADQDPDFTWRSEFRGSAPFNFVGAWQLQPPTVLVNKHNIGPPTWCEEQRVLRALWRVQLLEDLKAAQDAGRLKGWRKIRRSEYSRKWPCVDIFEEEDEPYFEQHMCLEKELVYTVLDYTESMEEAVVEFTTASSTMSTKRDWPVPSPSGQDVLEVECFKSATTQTFSYVCGDQFQYIARGECSPLQHVPWDFYRRRGFAIWCELRMLAYGLLRVDECFPDVAAKSRSMRIGLCYMSSLYMAWKSVLEEEELAELDRINKECQTEAWLSKPELVVETEDWHLGRNITPDIYRQNGSPHGSNA